MSWYNTELEVVAWTPDVVVTLHISSEVLTTHT